MNMSTRRKAFPFIVAAALGCIAAVPADDKANFYVGHFLMDNPLSYKVDYFDEAFPNFTFSWTLYTDTSKTEVIAEYSLGSKRLDTSMKDPHFVYEGTVSTNYLIHRSSYCFEMTIDANDGAWFNTGHRIYRGTFDSGELSGPAITLVDPAIKREYPTSRRYTTLIEGVLRSDYDSYYVQQIPSAIGGDYHGLSIASYQIGYHDATGNNALSGKASLLIYTNPFDWSIGSIKVINGTIVREIPLTINQRYSAAFKGKTYAIYSPNLSQTYALDRYDLKMYPSYKYEEDPSRYMLTNDVFFPLRTGREDQNYVCKIRLTNLTPYFDSFEFNVTANRMGTLFGSCNNADYCVGLGS